MICSRCRTSLVGVPAGAGPPRGPGAGGAPPPGGYGAGGGFGAPGGGDDYARLMAARSAAQRRNRAIVGVVAAVVVGVVGWRMFQDRMRKSDAQKKLEYFDHWAELDKRETGAFWTCVVASEVRVDSFVAADQILARVEGAYATQPKTFSEHLLTECVPKIERARQAFGNTADAPAELREPLEKYAASLPKLQSGIEDYAERIKKRGAVKDVDQLIQEAGGAWAPGAATPEAIAFDNFLHCAIPDLMKLKDAQAVLELLANQCFKKDPVAFMDRVRSQCGPLLANADPKAKPSPLFAATLKKFYEEEQRQLSAWSDCGRRSRKGKKTEDLEQFLTAAGTYMEARTEMGKAAHEIAGK